MSGRKKKPRMGRPPLPKGMVRETFTIRVTPAERDAFAEAASAAGKSVTQWARDVLVEHSISGKS